MDTEKLLTDLIAWLKAREDVVNAERIEGEDTVAIEAMDGERYFLELTVI